MTAVFRNDIEVRVPKHVAVIMDGNGRWAAARGLPRTAGHRRGADAVKRTVKAAGELGISYLTLFGFSSENWKRPVHEIDDLMGLLRRYLRSEADELARNNVRIRVIGDRKSLAKDIVTLIEDVEQRTVANTGLQLTVALSYGSRQELTEAFTRLAREVEAGRLAPDDIDAALIERNLTTAGLPDPDLLVRTSGEQRLSNFLLWQLAYAELVFMDVLWPDFDEHHLAEAVQEFSSRERRYGAQVAS